MASGMVDLNAGRSNGLRQAVDIVQLVSAVEAIQSRWVDRRVERALGITTSQAKMLSLLDRRAPLTAGELSDACGIAGSAVSRLVVRLELLQLVMRTQSTDDRRVTWISPTHAGREMAVAWLDVQRRILDELHAFGNDDERRMLGGLLLRMLANASKGDDASG